MSRVAKSPIKLPKGVEVVLEKNKIFVKGTKGDLSLDLHPMVDVTIIDGVVSVLSDRSQQEKDALAGTARANIANMVTGVSVGYEKKLTMIGVGYRAQAKGEILSLSLGYSHPIDFMVPFGITVETPTQTEIVIKGCDKQRVGQVAADIRSFRPPEPYKGKGVRYSDEKITRKEAKKK